MQAVTQVAELLGTQIRRSPTTEVDEFQLAILYAASVAEQFDFLHQCLNVVFDGLGVLIGIDTEVAELAALATERNVNVQAQRQRAIGFAIQRGQDLGSPLTLP